MAKVNFTVGRIDALQCDGEKNRAFIWDSAAPGLGLRATSAGAKAYIFQGKLNGEVIRITLGSTGTLTIPQAREEARRLQILIGKGQDPRQVKADGLAAEQATRNAEDATATAHEAYQIAEKTKRELIARDAWDVYVALPHKKIARKKGGWGAQHRADHATAASPGGDPCKIGNKTAKPAPLAALLALPLHEITAQVVQEWLTTECETRPTFAHNCFRKFRTFIAWCATYPKYADIVRVDCCITKDVKDITPANRTKEADCLEKEQLPDWFAAVRQIGNPVIAAYLQALLITGARRGELEILRWEDLDFKWKSMTILDKVEGLRTIPLTPYLSHTLNALPRRDGGWVFSSPSAATGHITEPRIAHTKALSAAGLPHVSLHGLRRSFGTLSEWLEVPTGVVAQIMGHKPSALAEKHYRRRPLDMLRMWHIKIESWILHEAGIEFTPAAPGLRIITAA